MTWNDKKFKTRVGTCKDCTDRKVGCHATCERYITAKKEWEEERARINKEKGKYVDYDIQHFNTVLDRVIERKKSERRR